MASKMWNQPFSMTLVLTLLVLLALNAQNAEAKYKGINQFCRTCDYRRLCNTMVHGATNWHDATRNAVEATLKVATMLRNMHPLLDNALNNVPPKSKADVLATCKDNFDSEVDNLKQALVFIENNDAGSLNSYLSAAISITDCTEAFNQFGAAMPPIVAKTSDMLTKQVSNCLAVSQQI